MDSQKMTSGRLFGRFALGGREVIGDVQLDGSNTLVRISDTARFELARPRIPCLHGLSIDFQKISLIDCVPVSGPETGERYGEPTCSWTLFPHFVTVGDCHVEVHEPVIKHVRIFLSDATALFYDFLAFGTLLDAKPHIEAIARANYPNEPIPFGDYPQISYFAGKTEIVSVPTALGNLSAEHNPAFTMGGPSGVGGGNSISVSLTFEAPISFDDAFDRIATLLRLFTLIAGRTQTVNSAFIRVSAAEDEPDGRAQVKWSFSPTREDEFEDRRNRPHPGDVLLDPIRREQEFSSVVRAWLESDTVNNAARVRFDDGFENANRFSIERLVGAANMFDLLPATSFGKLPSVAPDVRAAQDVADRAFRPLPPSHARESILAALGRIGSLVLKEKIRQRSEVVQGALTKPLKALAEVLNEAVDCRNYFVHGSLRNLPPEKLFDHLPFFTKTLEFVFATAELIDCGWDIQRWRSNGTTMSHPFGAFLVNFDSNSEALHKDLREARAIRKADKR